jgi:hypothetical protein
MSKTLEELGYEKREDTFSRTVYENDKGSIIIFDNDSKEFMPSVDYYDANSITMEELKAIYKWCEDNKWI